MATISLQGAYDQTRRWIESNDPERAIGLAQHILSHYPNNLEAYRILGEAYLASRQLDKAQEAFEHVLQSDPENIPAHVGLGITFERQGKLDHAVPEFEQAWEIKPDMPELRSQLLRLYSEAWGSEHAQLRLSRAGLARLYAKGHMLPQAIAEFRQVIADQPTRHDAKVALAEALWRDGQENEAVALCREILTRQPHSLKANLILGYLLLAQGKPEGQQFWDAATQIDPHQTVARALFETMPGGAVEEPLLPEWDEAAWQRQQELEKQPVPAATRPIPVAGAPTPVRATPVVPAPAAPAASPFPDNDDFLAVLLGGGAPKQQQPIVDNGEPITGTPFSLDDINLDQPAQTAPPVTADEPQLTPFSLSDLGLTDDDIAELDTIGTEPAQEVTQPAASMDLPTEEPDLTPFSFGDLGLSDDEIASLNEADATPTESPAATSLETDEPTLTPFSFGDLGLSDDEIASLNDLGEVSDSVASPANDEANLTPFSLSDLGLSDDEIASLNETATPEIPAPQAQDADEPQLTPFSFSDLGLSDDEIASLNETSTAETPAPQAQDADEANLTPFSFSDLGLSEDEIASLNDLGEIDEVSSASASSSFTSDEPNLTPFSLSDLGLSDDEIAGLGIPDSGANDASSTTSLGGTQPPRSEDFSADLAPFSLDELDLDNTDSSLPSSLQPFTFDESPPEQPRVSNFTPSDLGTPRTQEATEDEDELPQTGGYSWQQPTQRAKPGYMSGGNERDPLMPDGDSIFTKLKQRKEKEIEQAQPEPEIERPTPSESPDDRMLFSMDDVPLRDDVDDISVPTSVQAPEPISQPAEQQTSAPEVEDLSAGLSSGQIQPFSLSDLGLSPEEIEALGLGGSTGAAQSFTSMLGAGEASSNDTASTAPEAAAQSSSPNDEAASTPEANDDFLELDVLTIDEAPSNEPSEVAPPAQEEPEPAQGSTEDTIGGIENLTPFSLADLGLTDEEIAELGLGEEDMSSGLGITEEELAGLDMGGDIDLSQAMPSATPEASEPGSGDPLLDQLLSLGRQQGFVDIADIIAGVENPEAEAERIEQIGQLLHQNNIKIFDGDEEVDMEAEDTAEIEFDSSPSQIDFDDTPVAAEEPAMTPFSLADLGLTDEEIASLGLGETSAQEHDAVAEPAPASSDEPELTPFSLADLGLTDEEIASLGLGETSTEPQTQAEPSEPAPFSFDDILVESPQPEAEVQQVEASPAEEALIEAAPVETAPVETPEPTPAPTPAPAAPMPTASSEQPFVQPRRSPGVSNDLAESVPALRGYLDQLATNPQNHTLRLSLARISGQIGQTEAAIQQYRNIIRQNVLLDLVTEDIQDLIADTDDPHTLQRLHRLLGDTYSKQGFIDRAIEEYNWTYNNN